jgi:hypothetical protein
VPRREPTNAAERLEGIFGAALSGFREDLARVEPTEDLPPYLALDDGEVTQVIKVPKLAIDEAKEIAMHVEIPASVIALRAHSALVCTHGWTSRKEMPASEDPKREECLQILAMSDEGHVRQAVAPIRRSATESPQLGEWRITRSAPGEGVVAGKLPQGIQRGFDYLAANGDAATVENFLADMTALLEEKRAQLGRRLR